MAEIKLSFDLTFSRRFITAAGAAVMMLCAVPELNSESVTLSTYYPAPSGVYTQMITTGNTWLARDGGFITGGGGVRNYLTRVGIGTPAPRAKLDVDGEIATTYRVSLSQNMNTTSLTWHMDNQTSPTGGVPPSRFRIFEQPNIITSGIERLVILNTSGNVGIGTPTPVTRLSVTGDITATGIFKTRQGAPASGSAACSPASWTYPTGSGARNLCDGVTGAVGYVTLIDGLYSKTYVMPSIPGADVNLPVTNSPSVINFRCCPCPVDGCTGM